MGVEALVLGQLEGNRLHELAKIEEALLHPLQALVGLIKPLVGLGPELGDLSAEAPDSFLRLLPETGHLRVDVAKDVQCEIRNRPAILIGA